MTTDDILALQSQQAELEANDPNAPYQAQITVPFSELFDRGQRTRINATLTPELLHEADKILGERERSAALELGLQVILWMKGSEQFTANMIAKKLYPLFGYRQTMSLLLDLETEMQGVLINDVNGK